MYTRLLITTILSLGLLARNIQADTIEFASPLPNTKLTTGQVVPVTYKVHYNGMAQLKWAKVHLMTEDGYDAGTGTISTTTRSEWQDTLSKSSQFKVPEDLASGKYVFHVYGSTEQPCEGSIDITERCEGILSETLPVEITRRVASKTADGEKSLGVHLPKRDLYSGRDLSMHGRSQYVLEDGSMDTKKMLYFFSLL